MFIDKMGLRLGKTLRVTKQIECRLCCGKKFKTVLDLGKHPLVNSLVDLRPLNNQLNGDLVFPLTLKQCQSCGLVQLGNVIDAHAIYTDVDYLFFSSDMPGLDNYFREYRKEIRPKFLKPGELVVEIGSNDGILLGLLKDEQRVLGVDPAMNVVLRALKKGIPTVPEFFSYQLAKKIRKEWGPAKMVIANNCIAHIDDLMGTKGVISGVLELLDRHDAKSVFSVECNYWGGMVKNRNYSLLYHDHYSYFTLKNWIEIAKDSCLRVFDAWVTPAQGGSLRVFMCREDGYWKTTERMRKLLTEEENSQLNSYETSLRYAKEVKKVIEMVGSRLRELKKEGKKLAGYGASAKGLMILHCSGIDNSVIDYFVDDSPAKQGLWTPVSRIPVISRNEAGIRGLPDYFVILAPNYAKEIIAKEEKYLNGGGRFIIPTGDIQIIDSKSAAR